jgi:peptide/nickel transport system substrate-binding protein
LLTASLKPLSIVASRAPLLIRPKRAELRYSSSPARSRLRVAEVFLKRCVAALALLSLFAAGCSQEQPAASASAPADDAAPQSGGTIVRRFASDIVTLNPIMSTSRYDRLVANYLFTPVVYLDQNLNPIPGLAEKWEISADGKTYIFHLAAAATFDDGTPVRASDMLFSLRKLIDPATQAAQVVSGFEQLDIANTQVIDEHTLKVAFKQRLAPQLAKFNDMFVLPEHVYAKGRFKEDFALRAVGNGPYRLVRREAGKEISLVRRDDYWGRKPYAKNVLCKVITDDVTAWNAMKHGDIDETIISSDVWQMESGRPELQKTIEFRRFYTLNYNYIPWNGRDPVLSDKRVRHALAMCVDLKSIINNLYHGTARAMNGPFTPDQWAYNPSVPVIQFDPEGARRMFNSIGWLDTDGDGLLDKDKKPLKFDMLFVAGSAAAMPFAQLYQSDLKKIGVQMNIVLLDPAVLISRVLHGDYQSAYLSWDLDPDPDPFQIFHSSQFAPQGSNFVFYKNPEADSLLEKGRTELSQAERVNIYHRLHEVLADDQPYTWTIQVSTKWALNRRIHGVKESKGFGLFLWYPGELDWWIPKEQQTRGRGTSRS